MAWFLVHFDREADSAARPPDLLYRESPKAPARIDRLSISMTTQKILAPLVTRGNSPVPMGRLRALTKSVEGGLIRGDESLARDDNGRQALF